MEDFRISPEIVADCGQDIKVRRRSLPYLNEME